MIDRKRLLAEIHIVEKRYGSVAKAPEKALKPILAITHPWVGSKPVLVTQREYDAIKRYACRFEHGPGERISAAHKLNKDPRWFRYRVDAYREGKLATYEEAQ